MIPVSFIFIKIEGGNMSIFIRDWDDLAALPNESPTHILEVDKERCCAWLHAKNRKDYSYKKSYMRQIQHLDVYLSTHTFYGTEYKHSQKILRACGFDVEINNWDKEE